MNEAAVTTNWNGVPMVSAPLTELLLWLEDRMEEGKSTFLLGMGVVELNSVLHGNPICVRANAVMMSSAFLGNVLSFKSEIPVTTIDIPHFLKVLIELTTDNRSTLASIDSSGQVSIQNGARFKNGWNLESNSLRSESDVLDTLVNSRSDVILSEYDLVHSEEWYQKLSKQRKGVLWIQLPKNEAKPSKENLCALRKHFQEAKLAYQLLVIRSLLSSKSK